MKTPRPTTTSPATTIGDIRGRIDAFPPGEPFTSSAFVDLGTRAAVDQALSRLVRAGHIQRVTRGVFARGEIDPYLGTHVVPDPFEVVRTVAQATGAVVQVHGAEAARRFQLTTQVPSQPTFCTTGPTRRLHIGRLEVILKHTAPRKLALFDRPAGLALSALWYLGKENITAEAIESIRRQLPESEFEALRAAMPSMPAWMVDAFHRYERSQHG